jgi:3-deoxy-D-manno-octulosonic-acid transferase
MLEPCAIGAAVVVGPNTWNFKPAVELLTTMGGLATVQDAKSLYDRIRTLLNDNEATNSMRAAAQAAIESQQGATGLTVELLLRGLECGGDDMASEAIAA